MSSAAAAAAADTKSSTSRPYKIVLGADGYGAPLLDDIKTYLDQQKIQWEDVGIGKYYDIAAQVANEVAAGLPSVRGILCDGTGMGMAIVANKHAKIYAANVDTVEAAVNSRTINNSNILCLGGTTLEPSLAVTILSAWLNADVAAGWPSPVDEFIKESMNKIPHVIQQRLIHSPFAESESIHIDATTSSFEPVPGITGATWMVYRLQPFSALLRFPSGASQALHHHSYGHSIYIISGTQSFHDRTTNTKYELKQGSYLYTPAGHVFSVSYPSACEFLITSDGTFDMLWDTEATATASAAAAAAAATARK